MQTDAFEGGLVEGDEALAERDDETLARLKQERAGYRSFIDDLEKT